MAEQLKHKGIYVIPGWKLRRNCNQKTKDLAYDEEDISECDGSDVDEFETSLQFVKQGYVKRKLRNHRYIALEYPCCCQHHKD